MKRHNLYKVIIIGLAFTTTSIFLTIKAFSTDNKWQGGAEKIGSKIGKKFSAYSDNKGRPVMDKDFHKLVNKENPLPQNFKPTNLGVPNVPLIYPNNQGLIYIDKKVIPAIEKMFSDAKDVGNILYYSCGYRSYDYQKSLYDQGVRNNGKEYTDKYVAFPGKSEHQLGYSMDISSKSANLELVDNFGDTKEGKWVYENAHKYGFILRYPKGRESSTGYSYEPWHFRYVGVELATYMKEKNLVLEDLY